MIIDSVLVSPVKVVLVRGVELAFLICVVEIFRRLSCNSPASEMLSASAKLFRRNETCAEE